jgi:hypothetical protein
VCRKHRKLPIPSENDETFHKQFDIKTAGKSKVWNKLKKEKEKQHKLVVTQHNSILTDRLLMFQSSQCACFGS